MSTFGIPYAHANDDGSVTCPVCGARIVPTERKDFESFTGREYAEHYQSHRGMALHHIDGDPTNDDPANLRLVPIGENRVQS